MTSDRSEVFRFRHAREVVRQEKAAWASSLVYSVIGACRRMRGEVTVNRAAGAFWHVINEMDRPGVGTAHWRRNCARRFGHHWLKVRSGQSILGQALLMKGYELRRERLATPILFKGRK